MMPSSIRHARADNGADVRQNLADAKTAALSIKNDFQRGLVLDGIGVAAAKSGDLDTAVDIANRAYPHTTDTVKAIGEELFRRGDMGQVRAIAAELPKNSSPTVFYVISDAQARQGNVEAALKTVEEIRDLQMRSDAMRQIAERQAENGDYDGAGNTVNLAEGVRGAGPDSDDYAGMLVAMAQMNRGDIAAARKSISEIKSGEMKVSLMIGIADGAATKGDATAARDWLAEAKRTIPKEEMDEGFLYFTIPTEVKAGMKEDAIRQAATLGPEWRGKAYTAIAVACAEIKDILCVRTALDKLHLTSATAKGDTEVSNFSDKLSTLNVTAALIDAGAFDQANEMLSSLGDNSDFSSKSMIEPELQLQRVVALAQKEKFEEVHALALRIRADSVADVQRGTAFRAIAVLETKKRGAAASRQWASALTDAEDRAYAFLGIAQQLLGIGDVRLPYNVLQVH